MLIEITDNEAKIIQKAIDLYESQPSMDGLMGVMFGAMLGHKGTTEEERAEKTNREMEAFAQKVQARKLECARLRVKFLEVSERPTEFAR